MKGLELSHAYFDAYGDTILSAFPQIKCACGLVGAGSECLGLDDELSQDHDFEPGFCIFLSDSVDEKTKFAMERAYAKLSNTFQGFSRQKYNPLGGSRHGVFYLKDFLLSRLGSETADLSVEQWCFLPEQSLLELTSGELFLDTDGTFTTIRKELAYFPEDIRLKKLAGCLCMMSQTGEYNLSRLVNRGDEGAIALCVGEYVRYAHHALYLIEKKYMPYYKWQFICLPNDMLSRLLTHPLEEPTNKVETINKTILSLLSSGHTLTQTAEQLNNQIKDNNLRNQDLLYTI